MTRRRAAIVGAALGVLLLAGLAYRLLGSRDPRWAGAALAAQLRTLPSSAVWAERGGTPGHPIYALYVPSTALLPSGPALYIIDDQGAVVAYCDDVGDSTTFRAQWMGAPGRPVPADEVLTLLESRATPGPGTSIMPGEPPPAPAR